jgi:hypothetical protein
MRCSPPSERPTGADQREAFGHPSSYTVGPMRTPVRVQQGAGSLVLFLGDDDMLGGSPVAAVRGAPGGGWV